VGLVVRTAAAPRGAIEDIKHAVWQVDPTQPLANVVTLDEFLSATLGAQRFRAVLVAICGGIGLLLATIGTYGVTARSVIERQSEVGVRLALGGSRARVWWTVVWSSLRGVAAGAALGALASGLVSAAL